MRKALILLIILLLASGIYLSWSVDQLYALRDQVTVTEKPILGDPAAAEGLRATLKTTYDDHLFWTTTQVLGSGQEPETEYEFRSSRPSRSYIYRDGGIDYYLNYDLPDMDELRYSNDDMEFTGLHKAYKELYDATPNGRNGKKEVLLSDYLEYYPLRASLSILGRGFDLNEYYDSASYDKYFSGPNDAKYILNDYFKIPVLEGETLTLQVSKENTGHPYSWGESQTETDYYYPETHCVVTGDTCFFTVSLRSSVKEVPMDASHLEDGYGIYSFKFKTVHDDELNYDYPVIDPYSFCNAYPLDPLARILDLGESTDKTCLHLLTEERGTLWFTAIDQETLETRARISLAEVDDTSYSSYMHYSEDFAAVFLHSLEKVAVISISAGGQYQLEFIADYMPDANHNLPLTPDILAFDGQRLAIANIDYEYFDSSHYFAGYLLIIVDKDGVQYYGEYETSLNTGRATNRSSWDYRVRHIDGDSLVLEWTA